MAVFCPLFSGSSGNSSFVGSFEKGGLLVDVGVSFKRLREALTAKGSDISKLRGILITHEHSDHIAGLRVLLKNENIPIFATAGTLECLRVNDVTNEKSQTVVIDEEGVCVDSFFIKSFRTSHDAKESCGFNIEYGDNRFGIATDLGFISGEVREGLVGCDLVYLEANYDDKTLREGRYPAYLKKRIISERGHLSNAVAAEFAGDLIEGGSRRIILAHLSKENNYPELARQAFISQLHERGLRPNEDYLLSVAKRDSPSGGSYF